jgi:hypothetical protein
MTRGPKTPKHIYAYTERLTAEILSKISDIADITHINDNQFIKLHDEIQAILISETHDVNI